MSLDLGGALLHHSHTDWWKPGCLTFFNNPHCVFLLPTVDCIGMLRIKLGIHQLSLRHRIYLAEHYLNQR